MQETQQVLKFKWEVLFWWSRHLVSIALDILVGGANDPINLIRLDRDQKYVSYFDQQTFLNVHVRKE